MEVAVRNLTTVQIVKYSDENTKRVSSLHFLVMVVQSPQSELWESNEDDKYHILPEYKFGHYPLSEADYLYIFTTNLMHKFSLFNNSILSCSSTCFERHSAHPQEDIVYMQYLLSSRSVCCHTWHRLRAD
jgi:hypothetical protein